MRIWVYLLGITGLGLTLASGCGSEKREYPSSQEASAGRGSDSEAGRASEGGRATRDEPADKDGGDSNDSSNRGGMGGDETAPSAPAALGNSCADSAECASNHCAAGVCCDSACDGVCETCNAEGKCGAAESDSACPVVTCAERGNDCIDYGTVIQGGSCKSKGVCKTSDDCPSTPKGANTACDIPGSTLGYCDGAGECVLPTVQCGGNACTIGSNRCCFYRNDSALNEQCSSSCPSSYLDDKPARTPADCDEHADCRTGYLCSLRHTDGESNIRCRSASLQGSDGANYLGQYQENREVCLSPVMSERACSNGASCQWTATNFPGWKFCNL